MESSTLVQGAAEALETVVEHLPHYIQDLKEKVIDYNQPAHEMLQLTLHRAFLS